MFINVGIHHTIDARVAEFDLQLGLIKLFPKIDPYTTEGLYKLGQLVHEIDLNELKLRAHSLAEKHNTQVEIQNIHTKKERDDLFEVIEWVSIYVPLECTYRPQKVIEDYCKHNHSQVFNLINRENMVAPDYTSYIVENSDTANGYVIGKMVYSREYEQWNIHLDFPDSTVEVVCNQTKISGTTVTYKHQLPKFDALNKILALYDVDAKIVHNQYTGTEGGTQLEFKDTKEVFKFFKNTYHYYLSAIQIIKDKN